MDWQAIIAFFGGGSASAATIIACTKKVVADIAVKANEPLAAELSEVKLSLATQFGGNGGGMRQAINELQISVARLEGRVSAPRPRPYPEV